MRSEPTGMFSNPQRHNAGPASFVSAIFKNARGNLVVMNLKTILTLFLITAALVAFSGCTGSPGAATQATVPTPEAVTPVKTPGTLVTRLPSEEVARITVDHFGMNPSTEYIYEFIGKIQVDDGPYESVGVVLRYRTPRNTCTRPAAWAE